MATAKSAERIKPMARPLRIEYPGAFYHVTSRGNERKTAFNTNDHQDSQICQCVGGPLV